MSSLVHSLTVPPSTFYHPGELHFQEMAGRREKNEKLSRILMLDQLTTEHQEFYSQLSYLLLGTIDSFGRPRASIVMGPAGFLSTPDSRTIRIDTTSSEAESPISKLAVGSAVGVLGIDLSNRRRNRMHGRVVRASANELDVEVTQSYGNCPKYINARVIDAQTPNTDIQRGVPEDRTSLTLEDEELIARSGTFFIASAYSDGSGADYEGADVSHRGGQPGFVQMSDENTLNVPDYPGNYLFNTLGNIMLNPMVGLLFIDFENGDLLNMNGMAEIIQTQSVVEQYPGAQRLLRISIEQTARTRSGSQLRWRFVENSPFNPKL